MGTETGLIWNVLSQGECDIVRLLDLGACESYIKYHDRHRRSSFGHRTLPSRSINLARYFTPDSLMLKPLLSEDKEEDEDTAISSSISDININKSDASEVEANRNRTKSAFSRTTRYSEDTSTDQGFSVAESLCSRRNTKDMEKPERPEVGNTSVTDDAGVGVYLVVDKLKPGHFFGAWSIITQVEEDTTKKTAYQRRLSLISKGCEIIKISKEAFQKLTNNESMDTVRQLTRNYPSDDRLCRTYLKLSDWRSYREELVENVLEKKIKEHEISKGLWRTQTTRASPVPSPLCSVKPWQPVNSKWEHFPGSGWVASKITHPVIQAGEKRKSRKPGKTKETIMKKQSSTKGTRPSVSHPATRGMYRQTSKIRNHSPLPTHHMASSRYPQNSQPLVGDKLVIAKGSQRALILTHGGLRCNDFIREVEQSIV